tara:strand:+ start:154 stop:1923 length:1770 start_codon:yes stop_codon:yes gene_type:complete
MATPVDELIVQIRAETADLRRGLKRVNAQLDTTNARAKASVLTFRNLAKVFGVIGFARLASSVVQTTQMFEDLEATLQANTGSATETAQALDMIKVFTAQTTFQIDEVTRAFLEFRRIGIKPTEEDLRGIGNVAAAQGVGIDQIAQAIFKAGTTSIESLQALGFEGKTEGDKITLTFGDITETVDKSAEGVMGFVRAVGEIKFPEAITQRANTLTGAFSNLGDATSLFMDEIGQGGLKDVLIDVARDLSVLLVNSLDTAKAIGGVVRLAFEKTGQAISTAFDFAKKFKDEIVAFMAIGIAVKLASMGLALLKLVKTLTIASAAMKAFNMIMKANPILLVSASVLYFTGLLDDLGKKVQDVIGEFDKQLGVTESLSKIIEDLTVDTSELETELSNVAEGVAEVGNAAEKAKVTLGTELKQSIVSTSHAFTNDFVGALMEGESALDSFKNFAKNIVQQIIATFLQMAVVNQILNAVFGLTGGANALPTITVGQAGGGTIQGKRPTLVGERGPELFVPNTGGTIMNNMNTRSALSGGGGVTIVQNNNFALGVGATARAEVQKMLPQIAETSKMAVLEASARGGAFRKALVGG